MDDTLEGVLRSRGMRNLMNIDQWKDRHKETKTRLRSHDLGIMTIRLKAILLVAQFFLPDTIPCSFLTPCRGSQKPN